MAGKARIMIVEDQALVALDLSARITGMGYTVVAICDRPEKAYEDALTQRPDLVLMDIDLNATSDGIEVAERIRREVDIPIVFCTAYATDEILQRAKQTAPYGYILKPVDDRELKVNIELALHKHALDVERERDAAGPFSKRA